VPGPSRGRLRHLAAQAPGIRRRGQAKGVGGGWTEARHVPAAGAASAP